MSSNKKRMEDNWNRVSSQIKVLWGECEFNDDELKKARGNLGKMVTLIHEKSGEDRMVILQKMNAVI